MSRFVKTHKTWLIRLLLLAMVIMVFVPVLTLRGRTTQPPQDVTLFAKDVTFWLPDLPDQANPTIRLTRGRPVRLVLRNDEPEKVLHCFTIGGLGVKSTRNLAAGESEVLAFTPDQRGTFSYACLMHPMMGGTVVVE